MESTAKETLYGFETREDDLRRAVGGRRTYEVKMLWQLNHEIINLAVQGISNIDIARTLDISVATVSNTLNSELGKLKLSKLREARDELTKTTLRKIEKLTTDALTIYEEILKDPGANKVAPIGLQKKTADTVVLELSGYRVPTKIQSEGLHAHASLEEIEDFKKRGLAAARSLGKVIEVEAENAENNT
jgi:predicted transcriptional regulator